MVWTKVRVWSKGVFEIKFNAEEQLEKGKLIFTFYGRKLEGGFTLVKMRNQGKNWLITKSKDELLIKIGNL